MQLGENGFLAGRPDDFGGYLAVEEVEQGGDGLELGINVRIKSAIAYRVHPAVAGRFHDLSIAEIMRDFNREGQRISERSIFRRPGKFTAQCASPLQ